MKALLLFISALLLTSCITYNKCYDKFGTLQANKPMEVKAPIDTTLKKVIPADSINQSINLDSICMYWQQYLQGQFNDSLNTVKGEGKMRVQYWIDKYNHALRVKAKKDIDTIFIPYKDTVRLLAECPPSVVFDPLDKLPWYNPQKLWAGYKLFSGWMLIAVVIAALIYRQFRKTKINMYVEKDNTLDR